MKLHEIVKLPKDMDDFYYIEELNDIDIHLGL